MNYLNIVYHVEDTFYQKFTTGGNTFFPRSDNNMLVCDQPLIATQNGLHDK